MVNCDIAQTLLAASFPLYVQELAPCMVEYFESHCHESDMLGMYES